MDQFGVEIKLWKLIQESKRKVRRDYEFNVNSPEFQDLELLVKTMRAAGADVQYVSIPSNGVWYDHIGINNVVKQFIKKSILLL